ncbi:MAG: M67 family metallopeptidase [Anaerolineales bacterium]
MKLRPAHWQEMLKYVKAQAPLEACGMLAGKMDTVEAVLRVHNAEQSPVRFRMDPQEQYDAFMWIEAKKLDLIGIFHSHPTGPETVSPTDIAEAAYDVVNVIWSLTEGAWNARGFWLENKKVTEVKLQITWE